MRLRAVGALVLFVGTVGGGCLSAAGAGPKAARPKSPPAAPAATTQAAPKRSEDAGKPSTPASAPRQAIATPNSANGHIEIVIDERSATCGALVPFPSTCEPTWRVRLDLAPEHQRAGRYALGPELSPFSYRDAQGPTGGVWEAGAQCRNLGDHFTGSLEIVAIDADGINGVLSGAGAADGPFRARRCPSCRGVGEACTMSGECCNDFCHAGRCQP
jgi:hypothetical protein